MNAFTDRILNTFNEKLDADSAREWYIASNKYEWKCNAKMNPKQLKTKRGIPLVSFLNKPSYNQLIEFHSLLVYSFIRSFILLIANDHQYNWTGGDEIEKRIE